ncbi:hypothetical protein GCM10007390_38490 [Persicitalea jodogahamensis]|uniref:Gliding motility-associated C-terminal domain-containing protein n=1 Tax=Persicitalea jodogahamensis TaxID=402147 RepID=A0A8J3D468_9BACT|nr:hypothetical protein GCM10007390_38490 [Persicitalea jodogahamensis]
MCGGGAPIFIPDAFSPNGDGINDLLEIKGEVTTGYELTVFNAWGTVVFHTVDSAQSWDGKLNGSILPPGSYPYRIKIGKEDSVFIKTGSVLMID